MNSLIRIASVALMLALAGCGSADCNSPEVKKSLLELIAGEVSGTEHVVESVFGAGSTSASMEAFANGQITGVTTLSKDNDTGSHLCRANIAVEIPTNGEVVSSDITYQVMQIESDDADFEVMADQSDVSRLRIAVNAPINREIRDQARAKHKSDLIASYQNNPPIALADEEAYAEIAKALIQMPGEFDPSQYVLYPTDLNGDGFKEFIALWRDVSQTETYGSQDSEPVPYHDWKATIFLQEANEPGAKAKLRYNNDYHRFYGNHAITAHELNGNKLTVSDGTGWSETKEFHALPISNLLIFHD